MYVDLYATLDLSGTARISGNYACAVDYKESATFGGGFGGGVYVEGTFDMRGGEICDNFAGLPTIRTNTGTMIAVAAMAAACTSIPRATSA